MSRSQPLRICLVTPGSDGGPDARDIMTKYLDLSRVLKEAGHLVTLLAPEKLPDIMAECELIPPRMLAAQYRNSLHLSRSFDAYLHLRSTKFDIIYFADWLGLGYYCLLAKRQGLAFAHTQLHVGIQKLSSLANEERRHLPRTPNELMVELIEKANVDLCDKLIEGPQAFLDFIASHDWSTPPLKLDNNGHPLVSVCIAHFNRPHYLRQALQSIERQDYPNMEVVLVDDGSNTPEALQYLEEIEQKFAERGWQLIRQDNSYLGAARNTAVRHARGEYVLLMDDDNYAEPYEISHFVKAAQRTGADILTCALNIFQGDDPPDLSRPPLGYNNPYLSNAPILGLYHQGLADANSLIRRSIYFEVGGFPQDRNYSASDQEFFARAMLAGYQLETLPEPLVWYRVGHDCMRSNTPAYLNQVRSLRPYAEVLPEPLKSLARLSFGLTTRNEALDDLQLAHRQLLSQYGHNQSVLSDRLANARAILTNAIGESQENAQLLAALATETTTTIHEGAENACHLDRIEGKSWSARERSVRLGQTETVTMEGWAFDCCTSKPAAEVCLVIDGKFTQPALYGLSRPDVAAHFNIAEVEDCGFKATLDCSALEPGRHDAFIRILGSDLRHYHDTGAFSLEITRAPITCAPAFRLTDKRVQPKALAVIACFNEMRFLPELIEYLRANNHDLIAWSYDPSDATCAVLHKYRDAFIEHRTIPRAFDVRELYPALSENLLANYVDEYDWISWPEDGELLAGPKGHRSYYEYLTDVFNSEYDWVGFGDPPKPRAWKAKATVIRQSGQTPPRGVLYPTAFTSRFPLSDVTADSPIRALRNFSPTAS